MTIIIATSQGPHYSRQQIRRLSPDNDNWKGNLSPVHSDDCSRHVAEFGDYSRWKRRLGPIVAELSTLATIVAVFGEYT